jgi:hypothetical protein
MKVPLWHQELQRIAKKHGGVINPPDVVAAARNPKSPLHSKFTWDDTEAAEQYRLWQARQLIRVVVTVVPRTETTERVWVSLTGDRGKGGYRALVDVLSDDDMRVQLLEEAKAEFAVFRAKFGRLSELAKVFAAMDDV